MAYTRTQLSQLLSERIGDRTSGTATGGAAGGATLTTTDLLRQPGARYAGQFCEITSGTYSGNVRLINTAVVSSGVLTITPYNAFGGAIVNAVTFLVHRFDPAWKEQAINEALRELAGLLPVPVAEEIISGECLRNGCMEFWRDSSTPYDWSVVTGTATKDTTTVYTGKASLLTSASIATHIRQPVYLARELYNVTINFTAYAYMGTVNGSTQIRLTQGNTSTTSTALAASGAWTQLSTTLKVTDTMDPIYVSLLHTSVTQAAYWDEVRLLVPSTAKSSINWVPLSEYYIQLRQLQMGYQQGVTTKSVVAGFVNHAMPTRYERGYGWWNWNTTRVNVPYWFRLLGTGRYPNLTAATDEVDVNQEEARLLVALAGIRLMEKAKGYQHLANTKYLDDKKGELAKEVEVVLHTLHREVPTLSLPVPMR